LGIFRYINFATGEADILTLLEEMQFKCAITFGMAADADMRFWIEVNKYHLSFIHTNSCTFSYNYVSVF